MHSRPSEVRMSIHLQPIILPMSFIKHCWIFQPIRQSLTDRWTCFLLHFFFMHSPTGYAVLFCLNRLIKRFEMHGGISGIFMNMNVLRTRLAYSSVAGNVAPGDIRVELVVKILVIRSVRQLWNVGESCPNIDFEVKTQDTIA